MDYQFVSDFFQNQHHISQRPSVPSILISAGIFTNSPIDSSALADLAESFQVIQILPTRC